MTIPVEIQQLLDSSGNTFHSKVARWFQAHGWHILISPYYMDHAQQKAREIDLVAERAWPIVNMFGQKHGYVLVRLFVECKFVPSYSAFWFAEKNLRAASELVSSSGVFPANNSYTREHHYLASSNRVAKVFASGTSRTQENEPFYKALNQVLSALVSMKSYPPSPDGPAREGRIATLDFPVVLCSSFDRLFAADFFGDSPVCQVLDNFQLEVQYAYMNTGGSLRNDYFLVDFVDYDKLDSFIAAIEKDGTIAAQLSAPA